MRDRDPGTSARSYYRTIDAGDYDALGDLLAPDFRQVRGDRTIEGAVAFVRFMRDDRPETDTTHEIDATYLVAGRDGEHAEDEVDEGANEVAVRGRLRRSDGSTWFGFVDVFRVEQGRLVELVSYSNSRVADRRSAPED